ncbi:TolC family protein [Castellaniella sp. S9]|uniref:TolC family protein n=1 Tax=Castellaniella sp. S9 TaxID=2993652 RepID=UPI0022B5D2AF|nr:TolC family protein [Castellaniella sp. S9]
MLEPLRALVSQRAVMRTRILCALLALASASAYGQNGGLTLDTALYQASQRSAAIQASQSSVLASTHAAVKADQLPDPMLKAGVDNLPINGPDRYSLTQDFMTMRYVGIEQEWVSSGKRERRSSLANRIVDREQAATLVQLANTRQQTAIAWLDAAYAQRALALSNALVEHMTHELAAIRASYRGLSASADDVTQAQIMRSQVKDQLLKAQQTSRSALIALSRWVAAPVTAIAGDIPPLESHVADLTQEELNQVQPELLAAERDIYVADADTSVASSNRTPNWTWGVTYQQRGSQYSNMVSVGVSIPLPISRANRQDQDVAEKAALGNKARLMLRETQRQVHANIQSLSTSLANGRERIASLNNTLLPAVSQQVRLAAAAYKAGSGSLASVFNAKRAQLDAQLQVVDLERDVAQVWAQLEYQVVSTNNLIGQKE